MRQTIALLLPGAIQRIGPAGFPFLGNVGCNLFLKLLSGVQNPVDEIDCRCIWKGLTPPRAKGVPKSLRGKNGAPIRLHHKGVRGSTQKLPSQTEQASDLSDNLIVFGAPVNCGGLKVTTPGQLGRGHTPCKVTTHPHPYRNRGMPSPSLHLVHEVGPWAQ